MSDNNGRLIDRAVDKALGPNIPILVGGTRWKCPKCGDTPQNVQAGVPNAMTTTFGGDTVFHCVPCFQQWNAEETIRRVRENVPALVPVEAQDTAPQA